MTLELKDIGFFLFMVFMLGYNIGFLTALVISTHRKVHGKDKPDG